MDFRVRERGANFVSSVVSMDVFVVVEDKDMTNLTTKTERYQAALHESLNQVTLIDSDNQVKIFVIVTSAAFSEIYTPDRTTPQGTFRKEVALNLEIEHYEKI
jgi:hypothetical protein